MDGCGHSFLQKTIFHRLNSVLWVLIVTLVVVLAIYVSVGRLLVSSLGSYKALILTELNYRVPFTIEAQRVSGEWQSFTPFIVLEGLSLSLPDGDQPPLTLSGGRVGVDVLDSLRTGTLQMTRLDLDGLALRGELTEEGRLRIRGFDGQGEIGEWLREFVLNVEFVALRHNTLHLTLPGGQQRNLDLSLRLQRDGSRRHLEAGLVSSAGARIDVLAEGVGNPFTPKLFNGDLYLRIGTGDLGAVREILANRLPGIWADGSLDMEVWMSSDRGKSALQVRMDATDLLVSGGEGSWEVPLQRLSLAAELVESKDRWTLFASDLEMEQDGVLLQLPRLQLDVWGQALRVRATEVPLEPVSTMVIGTEAAPPALVKVFEQLQPRGILGSLQLSLGDFGRPAEDWEVEARFRELSVISWRGAPGVTSGSGYAQVFPGRGQVLLDSRDFSMDFPAIYDLPLRYRDFRGTIDIDWDEESLRLSSDLIRAEGEEGTAHALFALDAPLVKDNIGLQMDLLVGLQNSHPVHRVKYVPKVLNETLRNWLTDSIGEGTVDQGSFLWRGALKRGAGELRTVQLAFNVTDTEVNYHPRWPPVSVKQGIILIDDSDVSVWANRAQLYQSEIEQLSVEAWLEPDAQVMLAVDAAMRGPAADGLEILNGSPIDDIVSGTFQDWSLEGGLEVDLQLEMNLSNKATPPGIEVATRWQDVAMHIQPGNLPVGNISGDFSYSSTGGFSSAGLAGQIWRKPLTVQVSHPGLTPGKAYDPRTVATEVWVATRVDMAEVIQWLNLDMLAFATGDAEASVGVRIDPGRPPTLLVASDLQGISLDLPIPWRKAAPEPRQFSLAMPLGAEDLPLRIKLGEDLALNLDLREGQLFSGALGIGGDPAALEQGVLRITGEAPLVQGDEWTAFIGRYFFPEWGVDSGQDLVDPNTPAGQPERGGFAIDIDNLHTDSLQMWGQDLSDVRMSLRIDGAQSHLAMKTDWVDGEYLQVPDQPVAVLVLKHLDLEGLKQLSLQNVEESAEQSSEESGRRLELPDMGVSIARLHRGDFELGQLSFDLRSEGAMLTADNISGTIAELQLGQPQPGRLLWRQGLDGETDLKLGLQFDDLGKTLGLFGYEKIMETESGGFEFDLRWPGAPQSFSLQGAEGSVKVAIDEGRFLEAPSGASGALKVVNILNLADIVQRLSLSHMFEAGIPFDSVEGEVFLHAGIIEVAGMDVKGPSSFHFSGVAGVADRSLDGNLVATLPVADNLPWVAALTASLPVAAGVFVVSKLLQKQVNRLSSAVYSISGSWDDPEVKFKHIFDAPSARTTDNGAREAAVPAVAGEKDPNGPSIPTVTEGADLLDPQEPVQPLP
jgi:uncharacterized protein (TIGR02099 family)